MGAGNCDSNVQMSETATPIEQIAFLARSETRVRALEFLAERQSASQRDCRDALDASRSTIARTLGALEERDWVVERDGGYRLTAAGQVVAESFLDLVETVDATATLAPFLRWFPVSEFDLDVGALRDAELTVRSEGDPYAPADRQTELLRTTEELRCLLPSTELDGCRLVHERCLAGDLTMESVVSPAVAETITGGEYAPLFREMVADGAQTVYRATEPLPFYLGLTGDGGVEIGVECEEGFPRALLETGDASAREWGESVFEQRRASAERMALEAFESP